MKRLTGLLSILIFLCFSAKAQQTEYLSTKTLPVEYLHNTGERFGNSVSIFEDIALVSATGYNNSQGRVLVFQKVENEWNNVAILTASDGIPYDAFGYDMDICNELIVISAPNDRLSERKRTIYIFEKPAGGWENMTETAKITTPDGLNIENFGVSVSASNDIIAVGAWNYDNEGTVYLYEKSVSGWTDTSVETAQLVASDGAYGDAFGASVSVSNDLVLVGSPENEGKGAAYIFQKPETGWADMEQNAKLTSSAGWTNSMLAYDASIDNELIVLGAYNDNYRIGAAYVYKKPVTGWENMSETAVLTPANGEEHDEFGYSVSVSNETIMIGAYRNGENGFHSGVAYIYEKPTSGWEDMTETAKITASDASANYEIGLSVSIFGDNVFVGTNCEAAYYFEKPADGWSDINETQKILSQPYMHNTGDNYGTAVSIFQDFAVVGSPAYMNGKGCAYIMKYENSSWQTIAKITASDGEDYDSFGYSVSIFNDYVLAGAIYDRDNGYASGSVYVFEKPLSGWEDMTETAKITPLDGEAGDLFGYSVDTYQNTFVVGAKNGDGNYENSGAAYIYEKNGNSWDNIQETKKLFASDGETGYRFGYSVSIDNDYILIGADGNYDNGIESGAAYIFKKGTLGWEYTNEIAKLTASDGADYDYFGESVCISGDIAVVGAPGADINNSAEGAVYMFEKPILNWDNATETVKLTATQPQASALFGHSVSVSGTGVIVGAYGENVYGDYSGAAYYFEISNLGRENIDEGIRIVPSDGSPSDRFADAVAIFDGKILLGTPQDDDKGANSGSVYYSDINTLFAKELQSFPIVFYPNPTNRKVNIKLKDANVQKISISDITGKLIIEKSSFQQNSTIDLSNFESGIYIISVQAENKTFTSKIVKQ